MDKAWKKLKEEWEEHPLQVIIVTSLLLTAGAKFVDAASQARSRRAYSKAVNYRIRRGLR